MADIESRSLRVADGDDRNPQGTVAVVTGAGRGLGREISLHLAARGAVLGVAARSEDELEETVRLIDVAGGKAHAFVADVSDERAVHDLVDTLHSKVGPIDLLVNNAAVIPPLGPIWEVTPSDWWRLLEINLFGTFICARAVLPDMIRNGSGRIVNVASGAGIESPPYASAYVTSKAAVIRLSEELAQECAAHRIAVFAIDPGWMSTSMTDYLANSAPGRRWTPSAPSIFNTKAHVPPSLAADLVCRLATGAGDALSGRFLTVWDDLDDLISRMDEIAEHDLHRVRLRVGNDQVH